jgi:hypothetical protein
LNGLVGRSRWAAPLVVLASAPGLVAAACGDGGYDNNDDGDGRTATGEVVARAGDIEIIDPYARETVNDVAAVFMTLQSVGLADTLLSVTANVGSAWQIHELIEGDGSGHMQELDGGLLIPSGGQVHIEPGSYHVMLTGLAEPLAAGDEIELELTFASGRTASFAVPVRAIDDESDDDHDGH